MINITKHEPDFFTNAKKRVKLPFISSAWMKISEGQGDFKTTLREYILKEQKMLCAYCEKEIEADGQKSNTDHFKKRADCPKETLNYNNLLVSCKSKNHCEHIKDNFGLKVEKNECTDYKKIINPVDDNPNDFFEYGASGDILVKDGLTNIQNEKAKFTIKVFKLDDMSLIMERRNVVYMLQSYKNQDFELNSIFKHLTDYKSFIECIYPKLKKEEV